MRLGLQPLTRARGAPVRTYDSLNHSRFRFLSSTTSLSNTTKKGTEEDSTKSNPSNQKSPASDPNNGQQPAKRKSVAQADEELREKLEQMSGEGGAAGIEYEDGKPNTMKRSVRNNMFRYI